MKRSLVCFTAIGLAASAAMLFVPRSISPVVPHDATEDVSVETLPRAAESAARATFEARLVQNTVVATAITNSHETLTPSARKLRTTFAKMKALRGLVTSDRERRALAREVLADPSAMADIRTTLEDADGAQRLFGDEQAEARVYAIEVMREAARSGQAALALTMASGIAEQIRADRGALNGRVLDVEGLVSAFAEGAGLEGARRNGGPALDGLRAAARARPELSDVLFRGLMDGLWRASDVDTAQRVAAEIVKG
jgi:hypothetical protein